MSRRTKAKGRRADNVAAADINGGPDAAAIPDDELDAILAWAEDDGEAPPPAESREDPVVVTVTEPPDEERALAVIDPAVNGDSLYSAAEYDPGLEEKEYSRALMSPGDLAKLKDDITRNGFMTIEMVRELVKQNSVKETQEARGETYAIDPELMMLIDSRTNFRIFITGDNVYTREELLDHYPFEAFHTTPEAVFAQQEIGVFPPKKHAMEGAGYEYIARDFGDDEEFIMIEDLVGRAARKDYKMRRAPIRVVKTKVFLGKDRWDDFSAMKKFVRSFRTFVAPLMIASHSGDASSAKALTYLFGGGAAGPLALQDAEGARQERERAALAALEKKARALQAKEEELRAREAALYESLGVEPPPRPERDFMAEARAASGGDGDVGAADGDKPPEADPDDSVAL